MGKHRGKDRKRRREAESTWESRQKRKSVKKDGRRTQYMSRYGHWKKTRKKTLESTEEKKGWKQWGEEKIRGAARESERRGSTTRIQNRCVETGYSRSVQRWFRRSGRRRREKARRGELAGVTGRSW